MLNFSDASFAGFFAIELDIDIDDSIYAKNGSSKGKRLRCFLQKADDATAARTLKALWEHRSEFLMQTDSQTPLLTLRAGFSVLSRG